MIGGPQQVEPKSKREKKKSVNKEKTGPAVIRTF
jgi:hypothetical protein